MRTLVSRSSFLFLLAASFLFPACSFAQSPLEPAQLPAKTTFYLIWRGTPSGNIRKTNSLLSLWDDPEFASARSAFVESLFSDSQKQADNSKLSREEITQYASLLDNPFVLGYLPRPDSAAVTNSDSAKSAPAKSEPKWNGLFIVYDRSGKEDLVNKAILRLRAANAEIPKLTPLTVAGVSALKVERKSGIDYWAVTGKFAVSASELPVFEEILKRLTGTGDSANLAQTPAYQEAKPLLAGSTLEIFLRVPDLKDFALDTSTQPKPLNDALKAVKLDSIHVLAGRLSFEGPKTRMQGAILGDTSAGTPFDIWPVGQANPAALSFFTSDTVSISATQINLLGIYDTVKRAFSAGSQDSAKMSLLFETIAQTRLGMSLSDALALTTGEMGSLQTSPALDNSKQVFLLGIRDKQRTLKLLRSILTDQITSERNEGSVTYLKIALHTGQSAAGVTQSNFYHLAITPDFLLAASKPETLHAVLAQQAATPSSVLPPRYLEARKLFPEKINGFSYFDFQKVDWPAVKEKWIADANKAAQVKDPKKTSQAPSKPAGWLDSVNPTIFPRHLHSMLGASWKDAQGVHFDEWLE